MAPSAQQFRQLLIDLIQPVDPRSRAATLVGGVARFDREVARVGIWLREQGESELVLHVDAGNVGNDQLLWGFERGSFERVPMDEPLIGGTFVDGESKALGGPSKDRLPSWVESQGIAAFVASPIKRGDQVLGVLAGFYSASESQDFDELQGQLATLAALFGRLADDPRSEPASSKSSGEGAAREVEIIGDSTGLADALEQAALVATTNASVLILGESGTGKDLIARYVHERSSRRERPLVRVNCAAIPSELFESEFFGHVRGAFTGAVRDRVGRFELADGGTLFLDEVGEIPLDLQGKLLRVLQEGTFERVGEDTERQVDVRLLAATNIDLRSAAQEGAFRQDLYYRLAVFPVELPPLRERREDIPQLAQMFLERGAARHRRDGVSFAPQELEKLENYDWPGNVRELENAVERAVITARDGVARVDLSGALPSNRGAALYPRDRADDGRVLTYDELRELERSNVERALEQADGRVAGAGGAAELLGLKPTTLRSKLRALGIN